MGDARTDILVLDFSNWKRPRQLPSMLSRRVDADRAVNAVRLHVGPQSERAGFSKVGMRFIYLVHHRLRGTRSARGFLVCCLPPFADLLIPTWDVDVDRDADWL